MQTQYSHMAASSSPMYGGGPRWGANDLALMGIEVGDKHAKLFLINHPDAHAAAVTQKNCVTFFIGSDCFQAMT